ncbi:MAG: SDR family NAD(P)-dependent oxidoreductase [Microcoleus sp. SIO2G3]|nr:SDR family NAD(P)-dependent oxidoreductase [Microcoleus sp. SIO2G3]
MSQMMFCGKQGIGLEIARQLGTQGITVLLGVRDENRGREAAEKLQTEHINAHTVPLPWSQKSKVFECKMSAVHVDDVGHLFVLITAQ